MNPGADPLAQLRDIHLPDGVSMWPLAPGYWLLILCIVLAIAAFAWWLWQGRLRRQALQELTLIQRTHQDSAQFLDALARLLKAVAIRRFPDEDVAPLSGNAWRDFLHSRPRKPCFSKLELTLLCESRFQADPSCDRLQLAQHSKQWIKQVCAWK